MGLQQRRGSRADCTAQFDYVAIGMDPREGPNAIIAQRGSEAGLDGRRESWRAHRYSGSGCSSLGG